MNYNSQQKKAIKHPPAPLMILAGAGTGKTTTIVARIARLINENSAKPESILALTYTVKAAENLKRSLSRKIGSDGKEIQASNYHSFAQNLHGEFYKELGYESQPEVITNSEIYFLLREKFDQISIKSSEFRRNPIRAIISIKMLFDRIRDELLTIEELIDLMKKDRISFGESVEDDNIEYFAQLEDLVRYYTKFQDWKRELNQIDYGDMISNIWFLLKNNQKVLHLLQERYHHVIVDEFQDNNYALSQIIRCIAKPQNSITVVGDDNQSIYSFRGANIGNLSSFKKYYNDYPKYSEITLMENYRSSQNILDIANDVITDNSGRVVKSELKSSINNSVDPIILIGEKQNQVIEICEQIKKILLSGGALHNIAVLTRTNAQCVILKQALNNKGIPVSFRSNKLFEDYIIKDFVSWINIIADSKWNNLSSIRLVKNITDEQSVYDLTLKYSKRKNDQTNQNILEFGATYSELPARIRKLCKNILDIKNTIKGKTIENIIWHLCNSGKLYRKGNAWKQERSIFVVNQFRNLVKTFVRQYKSNDIKMLCRFINVLFQVNSIEIEDYEDIGSEVQLMTIHNAKGKEFDIVFIPFLSSSIFPSIYSKGKILHLLPLHWRRWCDNVKEEKMLHLEEERRLFYVGITRAKKELVLLTTEKRQSVFIKHLSESLIERKIIMRNMKDTGLIEQIEGELHQNILQELSKGSFQNAKQIIDAIECVTNIKNGISPNWKNNPFKNKIESKLTKNDLVRNIVDKPRLSSTSINRYLECPLKYKYRDIYKIEERPDKPFFSLGNTIHKVLEIYHSEGYSTFEDLILLLNTYWNKEGYEFKNEETQYREDAEIMLKKYYKYYQSGDSNVIQTEKYFEFELSNCVLSGKYDRIDISEDGIIQIIDYKTGQKKLTEGEAKKNKQLAIYALYVNQSDQQFDNGKAFGKIPEKLTYLFLRHDDQEVTIKLTKEEMVNHQDKIESIATDIQLSKFEAKKGFHCNQCDYKDLICSEWNEDSNNDAIL